MSHISALNWLALMAKKSILMPQAALICYALAHRRIAGDKLAVGKKV